MLSPLCREGFFECSGSIFQHKVLNSDTVEVGHYVPEKSYDRPKLPDSSPGFEGFDPGGFCPAGEFPKLSLGLIRV